MPLDLQMHYTGKKIPFQQNWNTTKTIQKLGQLNSVVSVSRKLSPVSAVRTQTEKFPQSFSQLKPDVVSFCTISAIKKPSPRFRRFPLVSARFHIFSLCNCLNARPIVIFMSLFISLCLKSNILSIINESCYSNILIIQILRFRALKGLKIYTRIITARWS